MWHRNLRSDSVLVHTGSIGTGAILVPGFGTQPYLLFSPRLHLFDQKCRKNVKYYYNLK